MVDAPNTTLHKRTGEGGWLATLSTHPSPLDQPHEIYIRVVPRPENASLAVQINP